MARSALAGMALVLALAAVGAGLAWRQAVGRLLAAGELEQAVLARGATLHYAEARAVMLPPGLALRDVEVRTGGGDAGPLLHADTIVLRISPLSLARGGSLATSLRAIEIEGQGFSGSGTTRADGALDLGFDLVALEAAALARALPVQANRTPGADLRIEAGRVAGRAAVAVPAQGGLELDADLALNGLDAAQAGATLRGDAHLLLALSLDAEGDGSGRFELDLAAAEVARDGLRKRAGQPMRVSGSLLPGGGEPALVLRDIKVTPLWIETGGGKGPRVEIHVGDARFGDAQGAAPSDPASPVEP